MNLKSQISNFKFLRYLGFILFALFGAFASEDDVMAELTAKANHDRIKIDFFYHGSSVSVKGVSDPGTELIVKITSAEGHHALRKKGKVAGLLWMNVGELKFEHVPSLYFLSSTKKLDDMLSQEEMDRYVIGYQSLDRHIEIAPVKDAGEREQWFREFVKFKEASKLYSVAPGKVTVSEKDGKQQYYTLLDWPYQAAPGNYTVTVYAVKDRKIVEQAQANVLVEQVGVVKSFADMAKNSAGTYGIISIVAALAAGFGVGLVFRKGGGAH